MTANYCLVGSYYFHPFGHYLLVFPVNADSLCVDKFGRRRWYLISTTEVASPPCSSVGLVRV